MHIRPLRKSDLPTRVNWVNDPRVHKTMHFDVPISIDGTSKWFSNNCLKRDRVDFAFEEGRVLCAMGGLSSMCNNEAELYIFVDPNRKGQKLGVRATSLLCEYGFNNLHLQLIYLYTNGDNLAAQRTYERLGFELISRIERGAVNGDGDEVERLKYILRLKNFRPVDQLFFQMETYRINGHFIQIVRDDIFPFIGGGSKARKAIEYEHYLKENGYNAVVTCGGIQSNHNRAIALMAARNGWKCHLVYHGAKERFDTEKGNAALVRATDATMDFVDVSGISTAMDAAMERFASQGLKPYYIHGGGHDLPGGIAYVKAVQSLYQQCARLNYKPDCIFLASGTGSTHAGIVVGLELVGWSDVKVIGVSVARSQERGTSIVADFANELAKYNNLNKDFSSDIIFDDRFVSGGYEQADSKEVEFIIWAMRSTGLIFDTTYSGKALWGLKHYLDNGMAKGNIIFWHTGGIMNYLS